MLGRIPIGHQYPSVVISGNQITLTLTDGLQGDSDLSGNGVIVDTGGPGVSVVGSAASIPSHSEWGLLLLSVCPGFMGLLFARPRRIRQASRIAQLSKAINPPWAASRKNRPAHS